MERIPVDSSNLDSVGYDESTNTLEVMFKNASVYQYLGVPKELYDGLLMSDSKGHYLYENIKGNFEYIKVD
jgi:hypothetical protein